MIKLAKFLESEKRQFVLSRQLLRSGTAVGALVREAEHAERKADFIHKMSIALKEANETLYWLICFTAANRSMSKAFNQSVAIVKS